MLAQEDGSQNGRQSPMKNSEYLVRLAQGRAQAGKQPHHQRRHWIENSGGQEEGNGRKRNQRRHRILCCGGRRQLVFKGYGNWKQLADKQTGTSRFSHSDFFGTRDW